MSSSPPVPAQHHLEVDFGDAFPLDDIVLRGGKLFEAGDYADKQYSMTPEELAAAVANFRPVPLDLEHTPTVLDGKLGELRAVALGEDGRSLVGTVALPRWLDDVLGGVTKVSCTWDRATKQLAKLALVRNPRVADAAIMAAFADFASRRHSAADATDIQAIHDLAVQQGAACDPNEGAEMTEEQQALSLWQTIKAFFAGKPADQEPPAGEPTADLSAGDGAGDDAEKVALAARVAELEAADAAREAGAREAREAGFRAGAAAFAEAEIAACRALPAERDAIVAAHLQAARDDAAHGTADFADGGSRVATLGATFAARPPHRLTEALVPGAATVLENPAATMQAGDDKPMSEERRKALYSLLPELAEILKEAGK